MRTIQFEGKTHHFPDDVTDDEISGALEALPEPRTLMSAGGAASTLRMVGPSIARGILGEQLNRLQSGGPEREAQRQRARIMGEPEGPSEEEIAKEIEHKTQAIKEADIHIGKVRGDPSYPLSIAQDVVGSVAQNAPGVGLALLGRGAGAVAAAPALALAQKQTEGQEYATAAVTKGAPHEAAKQHAEVASAAEVAFEMLPMGYFVKNLGKVGATEFVAKFILREELTEIPTTITQKISERLNIEPDRPLGEFLEDLAKETGHTALVTPFAAGMTAGAAHGISRAGGARPPEEAPPPPSAPPGASPPVSGQGADNQPLTAPTPPAPPPTPAKPSSTVDAATKAQLDAVTEAIDPEKITEAELEDAKRTVEAVDRGDTVAQQTQHAGSWTGFSVVPAIIGEDIGASMKQAANAPNYPNPNVGPHAERIVHWSSIGQQDVPLGSMPQQPGTFVIGQPTEDRSAEYLTALGEQYEAWRAKYMPNATVVVSNEALPSGTSLGASTSAGPNFHFVVPGVLRSVKNMEEFNTNARATVFFTAAHEFGHVLTKARFYENTAPQVATAVQQESQAGLVSEQTIAQLPPLQQAVVRQYNDLKRRIMDGSMTAQEFAETWISPGKLARQGKSGTPAANWLKGLGVAPGAPARQVARAIARQAVATQVPDAELKVKKLAGDYFSIEEYLAEQTARAAYRNKWNENSPLDRFLKNIVDTLRKFFISLKQDGLIKPGTAFQEWLDSLTAIDKKNEKARTLVAKKMSLRGPKEKSKVKAVKAKKQPKIKVDKVQHNVETDTTQQRKEQSLRMLTTLELSGAVTDDQAREMYDLIEKGDFEAFLDVYQKHAQKNVKFELDSGEQDPYSILVAGIPEEQALQPEVRAEAEAEWRKFGFDSRFFKAWFGDWRDDPVNASKIRRGAIRISPVSPPAKLPDEALQIPPANWLDFSVSYGDPWGSEPLVVYHATGKNFRSFSRGDLGFHFGTVRAAHKRMHMLEGIRSNLAIIPSVLNLRNPLYAGHESDHDAGALWSSPVNALNWLFNKGLITPEIHSKYFGEAQRMYDTIWADPLKQYESFEPTRRALIESGYDGVIYDNPIEGDISFIAFHPNQVKSLLSSRTFSQSADMSFELDYDAATPEGDGASKLYKAQKDYLKDPGPLRRALRKVTRGAARAVFQLQQLAHIYPADGELGYAWKTNLNLNTHKSRLMAPADKALGDWSGLGKENAARLDKIIDAYKAEKQTWFNLEKVGKNWRYTMSATAEAKLREHGVDISTPEGEELAKHFLDINNALLHQLNGQADALLLALQGRYMHAGPEVVRKASLPLIAQIHKIRKQAFFPQGRFGNYMITIEKKKADGKGYEMWYREAFESEKEWIAKSEEVRSKAGPDERVNTHKLTDMQYALLSLPTDFVNLAASELGLEQEQVNALMEILQPVKTEKSFSKYDEARLGLKGASADNYRSFANFTWHNANMISKLEFRHKFGRAIKDIQGKKREAGLSGNHMAYQHYEFLESYLKTTRDYVMDPAYEAQVVRAAVATAYLGFNPKTALMNLFSLVTSFADLTTRHGMIEGSAMMLRGLGRTIQAFKLTDLNDRRKGDYLPKEYQTALDQAIEEGVVTQSYAYHLAGAANEKNLERMFGAPRKHTLRKYTQYGLDAAMWLFRLTDLSIRRATFLAEFESGMKMQAAGKMEVGESAYSFAVANTNKLQGDYSPGNRAPILRGVKTKPSNPFRKVLEPVVPLATVFMTFLNHMAFHAYGGYELGQRRRAHHLGQTPSGIPGGYTSKVLLLLALAAGYEGLPGAENLLDLIEIAWRKLGNAKPIRQELRELVQAVHGDPQLWARGLGHNVAGFDVSRSLGLGRLVPGTEPLASHRNDVEETVGTLVLDMAGPTGSFIKGGLEIVGGRKPLNESLTRMPGGLGNMWTAYYWSENEVRGPHGGRVTHDLKTGKLRDLTTYEIWGKALGFNPTIVSQNRETLWEQHDQKMFWQSNRQRLLADYNRAIDQQDREAQADSRKAISKYNEGIPREYGSLKISGGDIARSRQAHTRGKRAEEQLSTTQRRYKPLYRDVKKSFEPPEASP